MPSHPCSSSKTPSQMGKPRRPGPAAESVFLPASAQVTMVEITIRGTTNEAARPWGGHVQELEAEAEIAPVNPLRKSSLL